MILMPLYYQQVRHEDVLTTGLLMGPGGVGAAIAMPFAGRLTDRFGGGPLALAGVIVLAIASVPFAFIGANTSIAWLSFAMFVRGIGIGFAFIPAMAAAYAALRREELSDATPQLNVLQRVGGSIGVAVLAVVLQRGIVAAGGAHATLGEGRRRLRHRLLVGGGDGRHRDRAQHRPDASPSAAPRRRAPRRRPRPAPAAVADAPPSRRYLDAVGV